LQLHLLPRKASVLFSPAILLAVTAAKLTTASLFAQMETARQTNESKKLDLLQEELQLKSIALKQTTSKSKRCACLSRDREFLRRLADFPHFLEELSLAEFRAKLDVAGFTQIRHFMGIQQASLEAVFDSSELRIPPGIRLSALRDLCDEDWWKELQNNPRSPRM
jgi:hypothetical protein